MRIPRWPIFPAKGEVRAAFPGASEAVRAGPNLQNENPPRISPGGPTSLAPSLPPVHPRSEAWAPPRFYIGGNHEYSNDDGPEAARSDGPACPRRRARVAPRHGQPRFHRRHGARTEGELRLARLPEGLGRQ